MNSLTEIVKEINSRPNYVFDVHAGDKALVKKANAKDTIVLHGSLEEYFTRLHKHSSGNGLQIQLYTPNGSSFIKRKLFWLQTLPVVEQSTKSVEASTKTVEVQQPIQQPLLGIENKKPAMSEFATKTDIENAKLATEVKFLSEQVTDLKDRNKKLERENDQLHSDYRTLRAEHETTSKKHELEYKQKAIELESKAKQGLSGIVDEVKNLPPEAWNFLNGVFGKGEKIEKTEQKALEGPAKHADADAQACIDGIVNVLLAANVEQCGKIALIVEGLIRNTKHLDVLFSTMFPDQSKNNNKNSDDGSDD